MGERQAIIRDIRRHADEYGMAKLAAATGIGRTNIYRMLGKEGNPTADNLFNILRALNLRLVITKKDDD